MKRIRNYVSYLSKEEAERYLKASKSVEPKYGSLGIGTHNAVIQGAERMKQDDFSISKDFDRQL